MYIPSAVFFLVLIIALVAVACAVVLYKKLRTGQTIHEEHRNEFEELKGRIEEMKISHAGQVNVLEREKNEAYHKGYKEGFENSKLGISILPWKNTETKNSFFSKRLKIEIGYQYQFFYGDIPILPPQTTVIETIDSTENKEENIKFAITKITEITEQLGRIVRIVPHPAGSLIDFAQSLHKLLKPKKEKL